MTFEKKAPVISVNNLDECNATGSRCSLNNKSEFPKRRLTDRILHCQRLKIMLLSAFLFSIEILIDAVEAVTLLLDVAANCDRAVKPISYLTIRGFDEK